MFYFILRFTNMLSASSFYGRGKSRKSNAAIMDHDIDDFDNVVLLPDADVSEPEINSESDTEYAAESPLMAARVI